MTQYLTRRLHIPLTINYLDVTFHVEHFTTLQKIFYKTPPPLYVWEERVLPTETPPRFDEVDIPLLIIINHFHNLKRKTMAFKLESYVRQNSTVVDENQTPLDVAGPNGYLSLTKKNILDINKQVALEIGDGTFDAQGNPMKKWLACSVPLSKEIRRKFKAGATMQQIVDSIATLKIVFKTETQRHCLSLPGEKQMFTVQSKDINAIAFERSEEFSPEDLVHL